VEDTADTADQVVVIFGGRSEIGLELATRLAAGATVVLAARGAEGLGPQVDAVAAAGAKAPSSSTPTTWSHTDRCWTG
jgi:NAD(P)-dependent dehydrogenase (short-subunit alcohol dehydrogenase family)